MKKISKLVCVILSAVLVAAVFTSCSLLPPAKQIQGLWLDSTGVHGYEFKGDGKVVITVFDASKVGAIGGVFDSLLGENAGSIDGVYTVKRGEDKLNHLTISYNILGSNRTMEYTFTIEKSALTFVDPSSGTATTYIKQSSAAAASTPASVTAQP